MAPACLDEAVSEANVWRSLERETGIEPATNSLEGCDSTTELLPPPWLAVSLTRHSGGHARRRSELFASPLAPLAVNLTSLPTEARARVFAARAEVGAGDGDRTRDQQLGRL